jgi:glycolate oxidase iron-sulfur subunit
VQTSLAEFIRDSAEGREAAAILRKCVHCGFCTATCPTYQVLGDDLDSPRGRIYLIKRALEGAEVTGKTRLHLDRCLTCRACETTCPSGVRYGRLVDIGRAVVEARTKRPLLDRLQRALLAFGLSRRWLFAAALGLARVVGLQPRARPAAAWPEARHRRRMLVLAGCVQPSLAPSINAAAARVLDRIGISLIETPGAGCCGALRFHLNYQDDGRDDMRALIDAWWPLVERGERLRRDREGIRPSTRAGSGLCGQGGAHLRDDQRPLRGHRSSGSFFDTAQRQSCLPVALHTAARAAGARQGGATAAGRRVLAHPGRR